MTFQVIRSRDVREKPVVVVLGEASSALGITRLSTAAVSVLLFFLLRRRRLKQSMTAAMMIRKAREPPTAAPMNAPETLLVLAAAVAVGVVLAVEKVLLAVEYAVGAGTVDESATFRS
jgi:hypothetical protein